MFVDSVPDVWDAFAGLVMPRVVNASTLTRAVLIGAGGHQRTLPDNHTGVLTVSTSWCEEGTWGMLTEDAAVNLMPREPPTLFAGSQICAAASHSPLLFYSLNSFL